MFSKLIFTCPEKYFEPKTFFFEKYKYRNNFGIWKKMVGVLKTAKLISTCIKEHFERKKAIEKPKVYNFFELWWKIEKSMAGAVKTAF